MTPEIFEVQKKIVLSIANSYHGEWDYFLINYEYQPAQNSEERKVDCLRAFFRRNNKDLWDCDSEQPLPYEIWELFPSLRSLMSQAGKGEWGSCTLEADSSGKYQYSFSYEPPRRVNGILNKDSLFENYTPKPL